jgi:hypothetical protein
VDTTIKQSPNTTPRLKVESLFKPKPVCIHVLQVVHDKTC